MTPTRGTLRIAAAALTAGAVLALAACGGGDGDGADGGGKSTAAGAGSRAPGGPDATTEDAKNGENGGKDGSTDEVMPVPGSACAAGSVKVVAQAVASPVNHLLLVATNTSGSPCDAFGFPFLRFDADQATASAVEESRPKETVRLAPGKSAYAAVITSAADGSGGTVRKAGKLSVAFQAKDGERSVGAQAAVALPGGTVAVDDSARTTYWVGSSATALRW
ncbi:DUF4232 domain-containing protein [Streptomyces stramineus]|uniref:DUF4232 domain-containing protein n=1 Tax=Streptomyces stramineus TaxID=173861 RepID=A0ABN1AZU6_9ACTN